MPKAILVVMDGLGYRPVRELGANLTYPTHLRGQPCPFILSSTLP